MHITLEGDYAVRIVSCLCTNGRRMDAKSISEETGVTLRFSLKILRKLVAEGIVQSYKGTQGGYELARPKEEITLYDVMSSIMGDYALSRCVDGEGEECHFTCTNPHNDCPASCKVRKVYTDISQVVRDKLRAVTFADLT